MPQTLRKVTSKTVNTTVTATDLLNGEITLPALKVNNIVRLTAWGDWINNSGGAVVPMRFQVKLGTTTTVDTNVAGTSYTADATRRTWQLEYNFINLNSTSAQSNFLRAAIATGSQSVGASTAAFTTGNGTYNSANNLNTADGGSSSTVDMSAAAALVLNVINGSSSASYETKLLGALVEIV